MIGLVLGLLGCSGNLTSVPGTTTRIEAPVAEQGTELELKIFTTEDECLATVNADEQQFETVDTVLEQLSVAQPCFELVSGLVDDFNSIHQMIDGAISNAVSPQ